MFQQKSIDELQQENERLDAEISVAQKREILAQLKKNGLTLQNFAGNLRAALNWVRNHKGR